MSNEAIVTIPPEVVRTLASSTVFVKASSLVNLDFAGMLVDQRTRATWALFEELSLCGNDSSKERLSIHKLRNEVRAQLDLFTNWKDTK
jgi:hypothetical protein